MAEQSDTGTPWKLRWLASYPKSGNTWVRQLITAYRFGVVNLDYNHLKIVNDVAPFAYQKAMGSGIAESCMAERLACRGAAVINCIGMANDDRYGSLLKTHNANITVEGVTIIPWILTAAAVYLIRDPRDVCVSFSRHLSLTVDETIEIICNPQAALRLGNTVIETFLTRWDNHVQSWTEGQQKFPITAVKYEQLLEDPEGCLTGILAQLGEQQVDQKRVRTAVKMCAFNKFKAHEEANGFKEAAHGTFFNTGTSGKWKESLTAEQADRLHNEFGEVMEKWGYK